MQNDNSFSEHGGLKPKATSLSPVEAAQKIIWESVFWVEKGEETSAGDSLNYYSSEVLLYVNTRF